MGAEGSIPLQISNVEAAEFDFRNSPHFTPLSDIKKTSKSSSDLRVGHNNLEHRWPCMDSRRRKMGICNNGETGFDLWSGAKKKTGSSYEYGAGAYWTDLNNMDGIESGEEAENDYSQNGGSNQNKEDRNLNNYKNKEKIQGRQVYPRSSNNFSAQNSDNFYNNDNRNIVNSRS